MPPPSLLRPERSAHAAIRGYLYQTCLGVLRWLALGDDETLVVEGDEDLDRFLRDGTAVCEQVKDYEGRLGIRNQVVLDSLRAFAVAYATLRRDGSDRRFVFTTTAENCPPSQGILDEDAWTDLNRRDDVIAELRQILPKRDGKKKGKKKKGKKKETLTLADALVWLDAEPKRWESFVAAVEMKFGEPKLDEVRGQIGDRLRGRGLHPTTAHVDRLVGELLLASSRDDYADRCRTSQDLTALLKTTDEDLARWSATESARHLRAVFDEVAEIGRLLRDGTRVLPADPSPGHLLTAAHEVVPFHAEGRRDEIRALAAWCDDDARAGVWLWTGEGGTGKTRLMIEWCRQLRAQGWHAGFLHRYLEDGVGQLAEGKAPRLVVVDYAETRQDVVKPLLYKVATAEGGPRCRVVLLARREADWWRILREDDADIAQLIDASPGVRRLEALGTGRAEAFEEAARAFSKEDGDEVGVPDLERTGLDRVLYIHMAALASVEGKQIGDAREALAETLAHERLFWTRRVEDVVEDKTQRHLLRKGVPRAVTALTLTGGAVGDTVSKMLDAAIGGLDLHADVRRVTLNELVLQPLYGDGARLGGLEPDLLGEELVASCLDDEPSLLDRVLEVADGGGRASALTVLTRLAGRRPEEERWLQRAFERHVEGLAETALAVAVEIGDPVGRVLAGFVDGASGELVKRLTDRCNHHDYQQSVPLSEIACEVTRRRLEICRGSWPDPDEKQLRELWRTATNLGARLNSLGRREEALRATREAVEILRQPKAAQLDTCLPDLALSLNNLGAMLSSVGRYREALKVTRESVEIRRQLAESRTDDCLSDLADSLNNLSNRFSELELYEEALEANREAISILRRLEEAHPNVFLRDLAQTLNNLSDDLSKLNRHKEAFEATREAVEIRRRLAMSRPDVFRPHLATSLTNLGNDLSKLERHKEALEATHEAIDILRQLAASRPGAFLPYLANSLNSLSNRLSDLGRHEEALAAAEEAVRALAPFFERLPEAFEGWMRAFVSDYQKRADDADRPVDDELLGPILAGLERLGEDG